MSDQTTPLTMFQQGVYDLICATAAKSKVMPSNAHIAEVLGASCATSVADILTRLKLSGLIEVERVGYARVVTITENGERTATPSDVDATPIAGLNFVNREPCFYCGVRADADATIKCGRCR